MVVIPKRWLVTSFTNAEVKSVPDCAGSSGIELDFFLVSSKGICFGFVLKTLLITQGCFSYC